MAFYLIGTGLDKNSISADAVKILKSCNKIYLENYTINFPFKIEELEDAFNGEIIQQLGKSEYLIKINENERNLKILTMSARGIEFVLDQKYHKAKYLDNTTSQMKIVVDGLPMTINMHQNLNEIVFKNSGDTGEK